MGSTSLLGWPAKLVIAVLLLAVPASGRADSKKLWSFKPDKGFIDNAMAFSPDGGRFAFVHTDAADFLKIIVLGTDGLKKEREISVEDVSRVPRQLVFSPDGNRLVLVWRDGRSGAESATVYDVQNGKVSKTHGPATAVAVADCGGEQCIALETTKTVARGATTHTVTAFKTSDGKRIGAGGVTVQADQTLKSPALRLLYFDRGSASLLGMQKGKYDKKRDIRLPERAVRWSLLSRKELWGEELKEIVEWTRAVNMRPAHPGQTRFVHVSDDLKQLLLVGADNKIAKVAVPVRWLLYEPKSLVQTESWDGKALFFSLAIDPVNPEAVKRHKADKERVDLYRIDAGTAITPLGQVYTGVRAATRQTDEAKADFRWATGSRYFSYLRPLKGFDRGGTEVELYKVGR